MRFETRKHWHVVAIFVTFLTTLALAVSLMILGIRLIAAEGKADQDGSVVTQITKDWAEKPFTSLRISNNKCKSPEKSLFNVKWGGTEPGCLVKNLIGGVSGEIMSSDQYYEMYESSDTAEWRGTGKTCLPILPIQPKEEQTEFFGVHFCGTQGGKSFQDATRPNLENVCPEGTTACSKNTSAENTICSKDLATCPITSIEFTKTPPTGSEYTILPTGEDGYMLVYSKSAKDQLPIISTKSVAKPCMKPWQVAGSPKQTFHPLELQNPSPQCSEDDFTKKTHDERYQNLGMKPTSVYDVQEASGVLFAMQQQLPLFETSPAGSESRKTAMIDFYGRPTIPWSLKCDLNEEGKTRSEIVKVLQKIPKLTAPAGSRGGTFRAMGITMIVLFVVGLVGIVCYPEFFSICARPDWTFVFSYAYMLPFWINIGILVFLLTVARSLNIENLRKAEAFEDYTIVNGCGDDFTEIPNQRVQAMLVMSRNEVKSTMTGVLVILILQAAHYALLLLATCIIKIKYFQRGWENHSDEPEPVKNVEKRPKSHKSKVIREDEENEKNSARALVNEMDDSAKPLARDVNNSAMPLVMAPEPQFAGPSSDKTATIQV